MRFVSAAWYWNAVATFIVVTTAGLSLPVTPLSLRMMISPSSSSPRKENDDADSKKPKPYRTGIMAVFTDSEHRDKVLVFKRKNRNSQQSNNATVMEEWQFPQGGINSKTKELPEEALYREVAEELGNNNFQILRRANELVRYDFPIGGTNVISNKLYQKYHGQAHYWFLCEFDTGNGPDLDKAIDDDFDDYEWVHPNEAVERIVEWKRQAYSTGLQQLGML